MKPFRRIIPALLLLLLAAGCGGEPPAALCAFRPFRTGPDAGRAGFYIDWQNTSRGKAIDSLLVSISGPQGFALDIRLQEAEGVAPRGHNTRKITALDEPELAALEPGALRLSLRQVNFTDGSFWEAEEAEALPADVEGGAGEFPVELRQALFYEESERPSKAAPIRFQSDWANRSESESVIGVTYRIVARTAEGEAVPDALGNPVSYVSEFFEDPVDWVAPGSKNKVFLESLSAYPAASAFRENGAARFELSVCRCVDSSGRVWENPDEAAAVQAVLTGKKGYSFLREEPGPSVAALIGRMEASGLGQPAVFVEDGSFCVLRYEDVDVRVELSADNEVLPDSVSFVYYSLRQSGDFAGYVESVIGQMDRLRRCVCPAVLTGLSAGGLEEVLDAYSIEDHLENPYGQVRIGGEAYETFEGITNVLDERSNIVLCDVFAMGKELGDPVAGFLWVRGDPYQEVP